MLFGEGDGSELRKKKGVGYKWHVSVANTECSSKLCD